MTFWGVMQVLSILMFFMGFGMYFGSGIIYAKTNGEVEITDDYYEISAAFGSISLIIFVVSLIINQGLFFIV